LPERSAKAVRKPTAALWTLPKLLALMVSPPCYHSTAGSTEGQQRSCGSARKVVIQRQPAIPARSYRSGSSGTISAAAAVTTAEGREVMPFDSVPGQYAP
jgi:hypothetical protein